jgi:large subunit ribosomal protein L9
MQIILQEDVEKLGTRGQLVDVAEGYARNFLLPRKLGLEATPGNMKRLEKMRAVFAKKEATEKDSAQKLAELLTGVSLTLVRKAGENDQLFGSVTSGDISEALAAQGYTIEKRKLVGEYEIPVKLHREVSASVKLAVKKEE